MRMDVVVTISCCYSVERTEMQTSVLRANGGLVWAPSAIDRCHPYLDQGFVAYSARSCFAAFREMVVENSPMALDWTVRIELATYLDDDFTYVTATACTGGD